mgnify:FL=1
MGHTAQTRRMANAGKKTGVSSRRSLKPRGAFGDSLRATQSLNPFDLKPEVRDAAHKTIEKTEHFWNDLAHQWFGTNPKSFPYNMGKWDAPTLSPPIPKPVRDLGSPSAPQSPTEQRQIRNREANMSALDARYHKHDGTRPSGRGMLKYSHTNKTFKNWDTHSLITKQSQ